MKNLNVLNLKHIKINKLPVHKLVTQLSKEMNFTLNSLQIIFVDSSEIHEINKEYLKHNYSTDIITFNYSEENDMFDGEIYISVEDAAVNAEKYKVSLNIEIIRLIIHGILHLLGYDDIKQKDKAVMKKIENRLVDKYKLFEKQKIVIA